MTPPTIARPPAPDAPPEKKEKDSHPSETRPNPRLASEATSGLAEKSDDKEKKYKVNWGAPDLTNWTPDTSFDTLVNGPDGKPLKLRVVGENNSFIERDENKRIKSIDYGDAKKLREFGYDGNELNSVTTTEVGKDGKPITSTLTKDKEQNKWYTEVNGTRFYLQGNVELRDNGDFAIQEKPGGAWRTERRDGTNFIEKVNASGTRIGFNDDRTVKHVTRTDGSTVDCKYEDGKLSQLTESKDGQSVTWTKKGEGWQSNEKPPQERKSMSVNDNGIVETQKMDGSKTITRGDGVTVNENVNGNKYEFDKEGRLTKFEYGGGKVREFTYVDGTDQVKSYKEFNPKEPDKARTFERQGTGNDWTCVDNKGQKVGTGVWKGEIKTTSAEGWAWKEFEQPGRKSDGMWHKVDGSGTETLNRVGKDGSTLTYDDKGNLLRLQRPNGTGVEVTYENGQKTKVSEFNLNTERETTWNYDAQSKTWKSEDKTQSDSAECPIGNDGQYKFKSPDGSRHAVKTDGSAEITKPDGSKVTTDAQGVVRQITAKNGSTRSFEYEGNEVVKITDTTKAGTTVWDRNANADGRSGVTVSELGDVNYVDARGNKVVDRTDFSRSQFNAHGDLETVTNQDGSSRKFAYDDSNKLTSVTDTRITQKGTETQVWQAQPTTDGTVNLAYTNANGKTELRKNVKVDEFGDYSYTGNDNKEHFAKTTGRFRDTNSPYYSDTISDARQTFTDTMSSNLKEPEMQRMERMCNEFEKRQADLIELRRETYKVELEKQNMDAATREEKIRQNDAALAAELDKRVADTYKHMTELASSPDSKQQLYDQKQRVKLVENFMYHAADPTTMNQGNTGTCWIMSSHVAGGMVGNTDHMARLLKEVSLTGGYDALHSGLNNDKPKHFDFDRRFLAIKHGDYGADWTPESAQSSSVRSAVGMIFDQTLPVIGGRREGHSNAGGYGGGSDGSKNIMYMVTGEKLEYGNDGVGQREKNYLLHKGAFVSSGGGHMWGYMIEKAGDKWQIVRNDQYKGRDRIVAEFDNLRDFIQRDLADRRPRRSIRNAMNFDVPGNSDTPISPSDNVNSPGRPRYTPSNQPDDDDDNQPVRPIRRFIRRRWG